jgi:hypothetical protein
MDVDLSRAGGMSRLLRQGKASEHTLAYADTAMGNALLYEVQRSLAVAVAHSGTSPHVPTYKQARGRHQSAITHVSALNARSLQGPLVLLWPFTTIGAATTLPGEQQTLQARQVGQSVGPHMQLCAAQKALALGRQLQHSVRGNWRSRTAVDNESARRLNSEVMRANQSAACRWLVLLIVLGCVPPTCSSTPSHA